MKKLEALTGRAKYRRNNDWRNNGDGDIMAIAIAVIGKAVIPMVFRPTWSPSQWKKMIFVIILTQEYDLLCVKKKKLKVKITWSMDMELFFFFVSMQIHKKRR